MAMVVFIFEDSDDGQVNFKATFDPELAEVDENNPTDAQALAGVAFKAIREFLDPQNVNKPGGCKGNCDCACK